MEYVLGKRSCVRLILEKDEPPSRHMVLCVCRVIHDESTEGEGSHDISNAFSDQSGEMIFSSENGSSISFVSPSVSSTSSIPSSSSSSKVNLILTDGWYEIKATLDQLLLRQLRNGKIYPGLKLRIFGATLSGNSNALSPLDEIHGRQKEAGPSLCLHYNGTRRAQWDAKLGFQRKNVFSIPIHQVRTAGGQMPRLSAVVQRVYPPLVMCKTPKGASVVYSMKEYEGIRRKEQEAKEQKIHEWIEKHRFEWEQKRSAISLHSLPSIQQDYNSSSIHATSSDEAGEADRCRRGREEENALRNGLETYLRKLDAEGVSGTEFLTVKIADDPTFPLFEICSQMAAESSQSERPFRGGYAYFTIWRPSTEDHALFREGQRVGLYCVTPYVPKTRTQSLSEGNSNPIRLTATKSTRWRPLPSHKYNSESRFCPRVCLSLGDLTMDTEEDFGYSDGEFTVVQEFDVVCILVGVSLPFESTNSFGTRARIQYLFICDDSLTLCVIQVRGTGCHVPYSPLSTHRRVVSMKNLTYRRGSRDGTFGVPLMDACEKSVFCESVADDHLTGRGDAITTWLVDDATAAGYIRSQCDRVAEVLDDYQRLQRGRV